MSGCDYMISPLGIAYGVVPESNATCIYVGRVTLVFVIGIKVPRGNKNDILSSVATLYYEVECVV